MPLARARVGSTLAPPHVSTLAPGPTIDELADRGHVMDGWTAEAWAGWLEQLAETCQTNRPDLAEKHRRWAANIRAGRKQTLATAAVSVTVV